MACRGTELHDHFCRLHRDLCAGAQSWEIFSYEGWQGSTKSEKSAGIHSSTAVWSVVFDKMLRLVTRVGLLALENDFNVLHPAECSLCDPFPLLELRRMLTRERAEADWRMAQVRWMESRVQAAQEDLEALHKACVRLDELTVERESPNMGTELGNTESDIFSTCISELQVAVATRE